MAQGWANGPRLLFISHAVSTPMEGKREQESLSSGSLSLPLLHRQSQFSAALASWVACGCLWEESPGNRFEHGLGTAASMNLFCTILCFCIQLQALFGTKAKGLGSYLHCINFISNHVGLELDLCLLHISVSQGIPEAKATLQSQVKGACECINICVFLFSPTSPVNCGDKAGTLVAGQHAVMQWFRADPPTRWGVGLHHPVTTPAANPPPIPSRGLQLSSLPLVWGLDLWLTWLFFKPLLSQLMMDIRKFWASCLMSWFHKLLASLTQKWRLEVKLLV